MRKAQGKEERNHDDCMNARTHAVLLVLHFLSIENYLKLFISCSQFVYSCNCRGFFAVSCVFIREPTGQGKVACRFYKCIWDNTSRKLHNSQTSNGGRKAVRWNNTSTKLHNSQTFACLIAVLVKNNTSTKLHNSQTTSSIFSSVRVNNTSTKLHNSQTSNPL